MLEAIGIILFHFKVLAIIIWPTLLIYWLCCFCQWHTYGDRPDWLLAGQVHYFYVGLYKDGEVPPEPRALCGNQVEFNLTDNPEHVTCHECIKLLAPKPAEEEIL